MFSYITNQRKISPEHADIIQKFVITMYDKTFEVGNVKEARKIFAKGTKSSTKWLKQCWQKCEQVCAAGHNHQNTKASGDIGGGSPDWAED